MFSKAQPALPAGGHAKEHCVPRMPALCDPSAASKEKENKPEQIAALQLEGRELSGIGSAARFSAVLAFLDFCPPSKIHENHNIWYQKRKHDTECCDPQQRAGLSREASPHVSRHP